MNEKQSTGGGPEREEPQETIGPNDSSRTQSWPPDRFPPELWEVALESRSRFDPIYSADWETAVIAFDELWKEAGDDNGKQYQAFRKTLRRLLLELKEALKSGRRFISVLPDYHRKALVDAANLVKPYKKFHDLYLSRVSNWLPPVVLLTKRGYGKFGLDSDAIIEYVTGLVDSAEQWAMSIPEIVKILDPLDRAAEILEEFLRDFTPTPTDKFDVGVGDGILDWLTQLLTEGSLATLEGAQSPPPVPLPGLSIMGNEVTVDGKVYVVNDPQAAFVQALVNEGPKVWVVGREMGDMVQPRPDRVYKTLPDSIKAKIKSSSKGYKLCTA
jgi:hypothetical protein